MKTYKLTCSTEACPNNSIEIELATDAEQFTCGPCSQPIASVVEKTQSKPAAEK
jgi:hypothetical protein